MSSELRRARGCAVEGVTLAHECHRRQVSRTRPWSASTPRAMQRITRPGHLASRWCAIEPATTRASRGREQRAEACTWVRSRRCHACTRVSPMVGQPGMTMERHHAAWHAAHHSSWPSSIALVRAIEPATTRASRGREQRPEACTWVRSRRCHACTRVSPMAGQSGMTMERLHAAWHAAHHSCWPSTIALVRHRTCHDACIERP